MGFQIPAAYVYLGVRGLGEGKLVACCGSGGQGRHSGKDGTTKPQRVGEIGLGEEGPKGPGV